MPLPQLDTFTNPHVMLFALPAALYVIVVGLLGRSRLRPLARPVVLVARLALVLLLVVLLAGPALIDDEPSPGRLEVIIDVSRSMSPQAREFAFTDARRAIDRLRILHPELHVTVAVFARDHRLLLDAPVSEATDLDGLLDGAAADDSGALGPMASDLTPVVLELATRPRAGEPTTRIIYTDGALPPPRLSRAPAGRTILVPPPADRDVNVRALSCEAPEFLADGQPLRVVLHYESGEAGPAEVVLRVDGQEMQRVPVALEAGPGRIELAGRDLLLPPGGHEVEVEVVRGDAEPLDNRAAAWVRVLEPTELLFVRGDGTEGERAPAALRALRTQGLRLRMLEPQQLPAGRDGWRRVAGVVLDRVDPRSIGEDAARALARCVREGAGLLVVPSRRDDELLRWNDHALAEILPLGGLPRPRPEPEPEEKKEPEKPRRKLSDPDPEKSRIEKIDAPTLILMLVIDKSGSMKEGSKLHYAKLGAIATIRKLHPEDRVGVVSYNDFVTEVVPVRPVGERAAIESAIQRITAGGGTDIKAALLATKEILDREEAAVKTVILLSDGATRPFNIREVVESLVASGISVNTVGIGSAFSVPTLTQIAKFGRGTGPIPARSSRALPAIMVDVAANLMKQHRTRTADDAKKKPPRRRPDDDIVRPETLLPDDPPGRPPVAKRKGDEEARRLKIEVRRPVQYLDGLPWDLGPSLHGVHLAREKSGAWVSLGIGAAPWLAHWRVGDGLVAMLASPTEGEWAGDLPLWDPFPVFLAQLVRFLEKDPAGRRYDLSGLVDEDRVLVRAIDTWSRDDAGGWRFTLDGEEVEPDVRLEDGRYVLRAPRPIAPPFCRLVAEPPGSGPLVRRSLVVPPPREVRRRGLDLDRLERWRAALDGEIVATGGAGDVLPARGARVKVARAVPRWWLLGLLLVFPIELLVKRAFQRERLA